jgi:glycosyltransferase involved in cell wall biosynthesis
MLDALREQAARLPGRVEVIPGLSYDETRSWYARASVVVVPSVWIESFCLVGLEAYANMKPVIGSRIGGIRDWLKDGETGWLFEPGNAAELAGLIDRALSNPARLAHMGEAAYARVRKYYSNSAYLPRLLDIYRRGIETFSERRACAGGVR